MKHAFFRHALLSDHVNLPEKPAGTIAPEAATPGNNPSQQHKASFPGKRPGPSVGVHVIYTWHNLGRPI